MTPSEQWEHELDRRAAEENPDRPNEPGAYDDPIEGDFSKLGKAKVKPPPPMPPPPPRPDYRYGTKQIMLPWSLRVQKSNDPKEQSSKAPMLQESKGPIPPPPPAKLQKSNTTGVSSSKAPKVQNSQSLKVPKSKGLKLQTSNSPKMQNSNAASFLQDALSEGPVALPDLLQRAQELGIPKSTVYYQADRLGVVKRVQGAPGKDRCSYWSLPEGGE